MKHAKWVENMNVELLAEKLCDDDAVLQANRPDHSSPVWHHSGIPRRNSFRAEARKRIDALQSKHVYTFSGCHVRYPVSEPGYPSKYTSLAIAAAAELQRHLQAQLHSGDGDNVRVTVRENPISRRTELIATYTSRIYLPAPIDCVSRCRNFEVITVVEGVGVAKELNDLLTSDDIKSRKPTWSASTYVGTDPLRVELDKYKRAVDYWIDQALKHEAEALKWQRLYQLMLRTELLPASLDPTALTPPLAQAAPQPKPQPKPTTAPALPMAALAPRTEQRGAPPLHGAARRLDEDD